MSEFLTQEQRARVQLLMKGFADHQHATGGSALDVDTSMVTDEDRDLFGRFVVVAIVDRIVPNIGEMIMMFEDVGVLPKEFDVVSAMIFGAAIEMQARELGELFSSTPDTK